MTRFDGSEVKLSFRDGFDCVCPRVAKREGLPLLDDEPEVMTQVLDRTVQHAR